MTYKILSAAAGEFRVEIDAISSKAVGLFSPGQATKILKLAAYQTGIDWIDNYLVLRFNPSYARQLGYTFGGGKDRIPFFERGQMLEQAKLARPKVIGKKGKIDVTVSFPIGHPIASEVLAVFKRIPQREARFLAVRMKENFEAEMGLAQRKRSGGKFRLSKEQTTRFKDVVQARSKFGNIQVDDIKARLMQRKRENRYKRFGTDHYDQRDVGAV